MWSGPHLYSGVCVVFVGCVEGELDLEDLGSTQQQFLPLLCAPGAEGVLTVTAAAAAAGPSTTIITSRPSTTLHRPQCLCLGFTLLVGPLTLTMALILVQVRYVGILFRRVSLHIHRFVLPR